MTSGMLKSRIQRMQAMLNAGKVLETLDEFYREDARFFENDFPFAESRSEARDRQAPFVRPCSKIDGDIDLVHVDFGRGISVMHNRTRYKHPEYGDGQINGVHVVYWHDDRVCREDYFSGDRVEETLAFWRLVGRSALL